jgi:hypothetical protein
MGFKSWIKSGWGLFSIASTLVGGLLLIPPALRYFKTNKENNYDDHYNNGKLISKEIKGVMIWSNNFNDNGIINLKLGSNTLHDISYLQIENGINLNGYYHFCDDPSIKISLKIMNRRVYVSTRMEDLDGAFIGEIKNNYWEFYKDSQAELIENNDSVLRFTDLSHDNLIDLKFINANTISLQGYFVGSDSVLVMNHTQKGFSLSSQKGDARRAIKEIK